MFLEKMIYTWGVANKEFENHIFFTVLKITKNVSFENKM